LVVDLMANKGIGKRSVYTNITSKIVYPTQHGRCVDRKYRIQYVRAINFSVVNLVCVILYSMTSCKPVVLVLVYHAYEHYLCKIQYL